MVPPSLPIGTARLKQRSSAGTGRALFGCVSSFPYWQPRLRWNGTNVANDTSLRGMPHAAFVSFAPYHNVVLPSPWTTDSEHPIPSPTQMGRASMTVMRESMSNLRRRTG